MFGTDPAIGAPTQLIAATMAAGFGTVAAVVALALTESVWITLIGGATPMLAVLIGSLNFSDTPDPVRESYDDTHSQPMTENVTTDGGINDK